MKKLGTIISLLLVAFASLILASCQGGSKKTIAVLKYGAHTSLDEIENGVVEVLNNNLDKDDYSIKTYNCNFDATVIAQTITKIKDDNLAAVVAIATPVAVAAANNFTDVPVIFAAVSDPAAAGVTGSNVTGTSDAMQLKNLVNLALEVKSDTKNFGYIYTATESNSVSNKNKLETIMAEKKLSLNTKSINNASELTEAFNALKDQGVEALVVSDDNNVASGMETLSNLCAQNNIGMYCAADSEVKDGAMMGYSISYSALAKYTGEQVVSIVKDGKKVSDVAVKYFDQASDLSLYYNSDFLAKSTLYNTLVTSEIRARGTDLKA